MICPPPSILQAHADAFRAIPFQARTIPVAASRIASLAVDWIFLSLASLAAALCVAVDVLVFHGGIPEVSVTETAQHFLLLACVMLFAHSAHQRPQARGFSILAGGFFACILIRELDGLLDWIWHGFWVWPAGLTAIAASAAALLAFPGSIWSPMAAFLDSKAGFLTGVGLVVLLVFSRVFGSGTLWQPLMATELGGTFKSTVQEGVELLGYVFIASGIRLHFAQTPTPFY
jgi:hypothetical protein